MNLKRVDLKISLKKDVLSICGGLYSMNAPGAIGYLFNENETSKEVAAGMFCDFEDEINKDEWTYYYEYKTKTFYEIN